MPCGWCRTETGLTARAPNRWDVVSAKLRRPGGYERLSEDEKLWVDVRALIDTTNEHGVAGYFRSAHADRFAECRAALDELDAGEAREQLERVARLFGEPFPSEAAARAEAIDSWGEDAVGIHAVLDEADAVLCAAFDDLERNLQAFLEGAGLSMRGY